MLSLLAVLLQIIMILTSTILLPYNNAIAQTYDTITKQKEITKNNPQIQLGRGVVFNAGKVIAANPSTNKIYVANSASTPVNHYR